MKMRELVENIYNLQTEETVYISKNVSKLRSDFSEFFQLASNILILPENENKELFDLLLNRQNLVSSLKKRMEILSETKPFDFELTPLSVKSVLLKSLFEFIFLLYTCTSKTKYLKDAEASILTKLSFEKNSLKSMKENVSEKEKLFRENFAKKKKKEEELESVEERLIELTMFLNKKTGQLTSAEKVEENVSKKMESLKRLKDSINIISEILVLKVFYLSLIAPNTQNEVLISYCQEFHRDWLNQLSEGNNSKFNFSKYLNSIWKCIINHQDNSYLNKFLEKNLISRENVIELLIWNNLSPFIKLPLLHIFDPSGCLPKLMQLLPNLNLSSTFKEIKKGEMVKPDEIIFNLSSFNLDNGWKSMEFKLIKILNPEKREVFEDFLKMKIELAHAKSETLNSLIFLSRNFSSQDLDASSDQMETLLQKLCLVNDDYYKVSEELEDCQHNCVLTASYSNVLVVFYTSYLISSMTLSISNPYSWMQFKYLVREIGFKTYRDIVNSREEEEGQEENGEIFGGEDEEIDEEKFFGYVLHSLWNVVNGSFELDSSCIFSLIFSLKITEKKGVISEEGLSYFLSKFNQIPFSCKWKTAFNTHVEDFCLQNRTVNEIKEAFLKYFGIDLNSEFAMDLTNVQSFIEMENVISHATEIVQRAFLGLAGIRIEFKSTLCQLIHSVLNTFKTRNYQHFSITSMNLLPLIPL